MAKLFFLRNLRKSERSDQLYDQQMKINTRWVETREAKWLEAREAKYIAMAVHRMHAWNVLSCIPFPIGAMLFGAYVIFRT
jgi:hypothetical protein